MIDPSKLLKRSFVNTFQKAFNINRNVPPTPNALPPATVKPPTITSLTNSIDLVTKDHEHLEIPEDMKELQIQAKKGDAEVQFTLAMRYYLELYRKGHRHALYWFKKAALQNHLLSMFNLACMCDNGEGIQTETREAVHWFTAAAELGDVEAAFELALRYEMADKEKEDIMGLLPDNKRAMFWYHKAADLGHAKSQYHLALIYENGHCGMKKDPEKSKFYKEMLLFNQNAKKGLSKNRLRSTRTLFLQAESIERKEKPIELFILDDEYQRKLIERDAEISMLKEILSQESEQKLEALKKLEALTQHANTNTHNLANNENLPVVHPQ